MNGIKRSLLVSCLLLSVGSSIQQPLHAGRPGLKEIVALVSNEKEAWAFLGSKIVELMLTINVSKLFWKNKVAQFFVLIERNEHSPKELLLLDRTRLLIVKKVLLLMVCHYCRKLVFDLRPFLLKEQTSHFYKKMLKVKGILDLIGSTVMLTSFALLISNILGKYLKINSQKLKFLTFPNNDDKASCAICLDEKKISELISPCKQVIHRFCQTCIEPWYDEEHKNCPYCSGSFMGENRSSFEMLRFILNKTKRLIKSKEGLTLCGALVIGGLIQRGLSFIGNRRRYELLKQL